tara:strand:- start:135 stop:527 length:393 start_codon:yes stop_codon:yes gene_type:complete
MATLTHITDKRIPGSSLPGKVITVSEEIDFSTTGAASGDVVQALNIKAGQTVLRAGLNVSTVEGSTATAKLGDGADNDRFGSGINLNAATQSQSTASFKYASDDTIDIVAGATLGNAKLTVWAEVTTTVS